jgi:magnesium transporter
VTDRRVRGLRSLVRGRSGIVRDSPERSMDPRSADDKPIPPRSHIIDNAIYVNGCRSATPESLREAFESLKSTPGSMAWIGFYRPEDAVILNVAEKFDLHELAVEDAIVAHQRPKADRYGDTLFVVLRPARYLDEVEEVDFGELHVFVGHNFVITVRHSEAPDLSQVRSRMQDDPELLGQGPQAVLYAILDAVVDGYAPVVAGLQNDIDEIEVQVFSGDPGASRRIYELSQEVLDFQRAVQPLTGILGAITAGFDKYHVDEELRSYLRDVADHVTQVTERVENFRLQLRDVLTVNATLVAQRQNDEIRELTLTSIAQGEEVKKISAWAAILFAPSLVGGVYGMNFEHMPETDWHYGYPFAVVLMALVSMALYLVFKRRDWI